MNIDSSSLCYAQSAQAWATKKVQAKLISLRWSGLSEADAFILWAKKIALIRVEWLGVAHI